MNESHFIYFIPIEKEVSHTKLIKKLSTKSSKSDTWRTLQIRELIKFWISGNIKMERDSPFYPYKTYLALTVLLVLISASVDVFFLYFPPFPLLNVDRGDFHGKWQTAGNSDRTWKDEILLIHEAGNKLKSPL